MKIHLAQKQSLKTKLNLKLWSPILYANAFQLDSYLKNFSQSNPFLEIKENHFIEELYSEYAFNDNNLLSDLLEQIEAPLFPTPISQSIAHDIIDELNDEGYFTGNIKTIAQTHNTTEQNVEKIRQRFLHLEPIGIASLNLQESLQFQIEDLDIDSTVQANLLQFIQSFKIEDLTSHASEFSKYIKQLHFPPAAKYLNKDIPIIADFLLHISNNELNLQSNDKYSAEVIFDKSLIQDNPTLTKKVKEARDIIDFLDLRKKTLHKVVLLIVQKQKDFFYDNKPLKPLTMQIIANELNLSQSTISRAVSNKYLEFQHKNHALKEFFISSCGTKDISQQHIKEFLAQIIQLEKKDKPYSDERLRTLINDKFNIQLSRRVITKYRLSLNFLSSTNRKKLYTI